MSCNCNNNLQQNYVNNIVQQNYPNNTVQQLCYGCGCNECTKVSCGCDDCSRRRNRKERRDYRKENNSESDNDNKKEKRCDKCHHRKCECVEYVQCYKTKCGFISASLSVTANPTFYTAAGQLITYSYTITNTGSVTICDPIRICDDRLGGQIIPCSFILPGASQTFTRTYTTLSSDVLVPGITSSATAYIEVECKKWVSTCPASVTVTFGNADLFGSISQATVPSGLVEVTVTISNSALSATAAQNVSLTLPFPANISGVVAAVPPPTAINSNNVVITIPSLAIGASSAFRFQYVAGSTASGAAYAFAGTILSSTYDPNPSNNYISNTFVFP